MNISKLNSTNLYNYSNSNNTGKAEKSNIAKQSLTTGKNSKINKVIESLMKQKENLTDNKNKLVENALKNNTDPKTLKEQIEEIDKQIDEIDKQIKDIQSEDLKKNMGKKDTDKKTEASKQEQKDNPSENNQNNSTLNNIINVSNNLKESNILINQRNTSINNSKILSTEIKLDEGRRINPVAKKKQLSELENSIDYVNKKLAKSLSKANTNTDDKNNIAQKNETGRRVSGSENEENQAGKSSINARQSEQEINCYVNDKESKNTNKKINTLA